MERDRDVVGDVAKNVVTSIGFAAASDQQRIALIDGPRSITYGELLAEAQRIAGGLSDAGVQAGDFVLFWSGNRSEYLSTYLACAWVGAVFAPLHPAFGRREVEFAAEVCAPRVAIVEQQFAAEYASVSRRTSHLPAHFVLLSDDSDAPLPDIPAQPFDEWGRSSMVPEIAAVHETTPLLLYFSSGTTSQPKPILHSHGTQTWNAHTYKKVWDFRRDDTVLNPMPLSWAFGLSAVTMPALTAKGTVAILRRFRARDVLAEVQRLQATLLPATATMLAQLLDVSDGDLTPLQSLRHVYLGGEPRNEPVIAAFEQFLGHALIESWASSEAHPVTSTGTDPHAPRGSIGRPVPGVSIRIVDPTGHEVPDGEPGEALIKCPGTMLGYLNDPELTSSKLTRDGWLRSGDILRRDEDGYLYIVGRLGNMIIRGGTNIAPPEIETALREIEDVDDAGVVGIPDTVYGEKVVALVTPAPGASPTSERVLAALRRGGLASYKVPQHLFVVPTLPVNDSGKKSIREMQQLAAQLLSPDHG